MFGEGEVLIPILLMSLGELSQAQMRRQLRFEDIKRDEKLRISLREN